jgi:thiosulfate reductase cytochrome b subunit
VARIRAGAAVHDEWRFAGEPIPALLLTLVETAGPAMTHVKRLHPLPLRIMHWTNAVAMLIMIASGWKIYNDEVLFGWLHFPDEITIGGEQQGALQWHFFAMWILGLNGLAYLIYGFTTGRFRRMLTPLSIGEILATIRDTLRFKLSHDDLTKYNGVQKMLYISIIMIGILQVLTGLAIWKPVQFSELAALFGSFQTARIIHFICMAAIVGFVLVHVALALLVPQTLIGMLTGGPKIDDERDRKFENAARQDAH